MDFCLSEDLLRLQQQVRELVCAELAPHDAAIERTGRIPEGAVQGLRRMGMFGLNTPSEYGGRGLSMLGTCIALQELAKCHIAYYYLAGVNVHIGSKGIEFAGTEEQKRRWLPELASGRVIGAFALIEPEAGSDAAGIATIARRIVARRALSSLNDG
jgi:acyl-CoA dehydrogenase